MFGTRRWKVSWGSLCSNRELLALASHWYWLILEELSCMLLEVCPQCKYSKVSCPRCRMKHKLLNVEVSVFSLVLSRSRDKRDRTLILQTGWSLIVYSNGVRVRAALAAAWRSAWQPPRSTKLSTFLTRVCPCHDLASHASDVQPWLVSALPRQWSGCGPCTCKCNRRTRIGPCSPSSSRLWVLLRSHHHRQKNLFLLYRNYSFRRRTVAVTLTVSHARDLRGWLERWLIFAAAPVAGDCWRHVTEDTGRHYCPHRQWLSRRNSNDELVFNGCSSEYQTPLH